MKNGQSIYSSDLLGLFTGDKLFSTTNRLFLGLFEILMLPLLILAIIASIAGTHCDIDGIREPVDGSSLYGNNIITAGLIPSSNAIGIIGTFNLMLVF